MPAYYDRYADVMRQLEHGYALWNPDPFDQYDEIRLGDVGVIHGGKFIPGWHMMWRDPSLLVDQTYVNRINAEKPLRTESILEVGVGLSLASALPTNEVGVGVTYKCASEKGGLIALEDGFAISEDLNKNRERELAEHLKLNCTHILESCGTPALDDLVAITGTTKTGDWDNFFYESNSRMLQASVDASLLSDAVLVKTHLVIKHSLGQTVRQGSGHHHNETRGHGRPDPQESCCRGPKNQTIFIRSLRIRKRKFQKTPRVIKAAAEPKNLGGDFSGGPDGTTVTIDSNDTDEISSDVERELIVTRDEHPDTLAKSKGLYDELFDYLFDNTKAEMALVHDRDVEFMLKKRSQDPNVSFTIALCKTHRFPEVAVLYHESNPFVDLADSLHWKLIESPAHANIISQPASQPLPNRSHLVTRSRQPGKGKSKQSGDQKSNKMRSLLFQQSRLERMAYAILERSERGWFTGALGRSGTKKSLQGSKAELQDILSNSKTQIQLRDVDKPEANPASREGEGEQIFDETTSEARLGTLTLMKPKVLEQRRQLKKQSSFGHFPPAASTIFFGRSDYVSWLVESLVTAPAYHAILGPGGIGKTSLALNVLHDPRIIAAYGSHRYYLACDTTVDASGIMAGISDMFDLEENSFLESLRQHCDIITSKILFLLDNFETPWERLEARPKVEELLAQLCEIPNLSIIVTLRGAERPCGVRWTRPFFPILGPLDLAAARQTFVSIADVREEDADMVTLLEEVDCIPLAITLLAAQACYLSCASLLARWRSLNTSMVTRGWESRLSSLDVSISLSLTSTRFTNNPVALSLLQVLSLLPDGATIEELAAMTPSHVNVHKAVTTILQVALAHTRTQDRISVLAPVREHVRSKHPISDSLLASVFSYHSKLSSYAFESEMTIESLVMEARLSRCIGNIHSVLLACLMVDALCEESIEAAISVSSFRIGKDLGSIALLLKESIKHAILLQKPSLHAACLVELGCRMMYSLPESHASAEACLEESVNLLRNLPESSDLLVSALAALTQLLYLQSRYEEGIKYGQESVRLMTEATSPVTSALAYMQLGVTLMANHDFQEGTKAMDLAASCFDPREYPILALKYSEFLSSAYNRRSMFSKAIEAADISLNPNLDMENPGMRQHYSAAALLSCRGISYMFLGRYEEAINDFDESIGTMASYEMDNQIGKVLTFLGTARMGRSDFEAASTAFQVALHLPYSAAHFHPNQYMAALELCQDHIEQAIIYCAKTEQDIHHRRIMSTANSLSLQLQSQVHMRRGDATDAFSMSLLSVVLSYKLQDRGELARNFLILGDAYLFIENDIATAKACYEASLDLIRYIGVWRWIANSLMRLGVINHLQGDSSLAVRRLNQAIGFYKKTAGLAWAEYCRERLRVIDNGIIEERVPFFPPMFQCF